MNRQDHSNLITQACLGFASLLPDVVDAQFAVGDALAKYGFRPPQGSVVLVRQLRLHFGEGGLVLIVGMYQDPEGAVFYGGQIRTPFFEEESWGRVSLSGPDLLAWYQALVTSTANPSIVIEPEEIEHSRTVASVYLLGMGGMTLSGHRRLLAATVHARSHPEPGYELRYLEELRPEVRQQIRAKVRHPITLVANRIPASYRIQDMKVLRRLHGVESEVAVLVDDGEDFECLVDLQMGNTEVRNLLETVREYLHPRQVVWRHSELRAR